MSVFIKDPATGLLYSRGDGLILGGSGRSQGLGGVPNQDPGAGVPGSGDADKLSLVISGVTVETGVDRTYLVSSGRINSETAATNRSYCLNRNGFCVWYVTGTGLPAPALGPLEVSTKVDGVDSTAQVKTQFYLYNGTWYLHRTFPMGPRAAGLFYGRSTSKCFPMTFANEYVTPGNDYSALPRRLSDNGAAAGPTPLIRGLGTGGTATVDIDCGCPEAEAPAPAHVAAFDSSPVRHCCNVIDVTIGGGSVFDGPWRCVKVGGNRYLTSRYDQRRCQIFVNGFTNVWTLQLAQWSATDTSQLYSTSSWTGATYPACPSSKPWTFGSSVASPVPVLRSVRYWDCPPTDTEKTV